MNRVVTAFLQLVDADVSGSILVAATNHVELLDRAVFRRFDVIVPFDKPTREQLVDLLKLRLGAVGFGEQDADRLAGSAEGWSFADVVRACDDAVRSMALDDREEIQRRILKTQDMRFSLTVSVLGPGVYAAIKPRIEADALVSVEV